MANELIDRQLSLKSLIANSGPVGEKAFSSRVPREPAIEHCPLALHDFGKKFPLEVEIVLIDHAEFGQLNYVGNIVGQHLEECVTGVLYWYASEKVLDIVADEDVILCQCNVLNVSEEPL
ncbi:hypothetical protein M514_26273 [Trichuris suis]|uniref:Uncharacterized protein n=1 Tax=Trichuris suis TaxID=68888 RepID=A0A085MWI9_9BILA|nr:hypothetical protein M514_26273 [Trichuris suis]